MYGLDRRLCDRRSAMLMEMDSATGASDGRLISSRRRVRDASRREERVTAAKAPPRRRRALPKFDAALTTVLFVCVCELS